MVKRIPTKLKAIIIYCCKGNIIFSHNKEKQKYVQWIILLL